MPCPLPPQPDIIVFLLDDARFDHLEGLPETMARLAPTAVEFQRAYVNTPLCCPERASFLAGGYYAHQVGVLNNERPNGGATQFDDTRSLAVRLQEVGYATSLLGKYLNEYEELGAYVPPGWTDWGVHAENDGWTGFDVFTGSSGPDTWAPADIAYYPGYITDWQADRALRFLRRYKDNPQFLYLSFRAPHHPHTPAEEDVDLYPDYLYRGRGYQEADLSDKPAWVQAQPLWTAEEQLVADSNNRQRLQSLKAVDRAIVAVIDAVEAAGKRESTLFVLTSDNGMMFGEHRLISKGVGYEESVRIPLVMANPAFTPGTIDTLVAMPLDIPATIQSLAGLSLEGEGQDLAPWLCGEGGAGRDHVFVEAWFGEKVPAWSGLITASYSYLENERGEGELYNLDIDPYQLESRHDDPAERDRIEGYAATVAAERGLSILTNDIPAGTVGEVYRAELARWGGTEPVRWSVQNGELPAGLRLSEEGVIEGVPTETANVVVRFLAEDSSISPYHGGPQRNSRPVALLVSEAPSSKPFAADPDCGCDGEGRAAGVLGLLWWGRRRRPGSGEGGAGSLWQGGAHRS